MSSDLSRLSRLGMFVLLCCPWRVCKNKVVGTFKNPPPAVSAVHSSST